MIYYIENEHLRVGVSSLGAELMSIIKKDGGVEYLWQGDKKYWGGRAPNMFPICGRLFNGKYTYCGKEYSMPNHGIARSSELTLTEKTDSKIVLTLNSNKETKKAYPFDFSYDVTLELNESTLKVTYTVKNKSGKELIFGLGGHPAFNVPINSQGNFDDYYVEFENACNALRIDFSPACYCTGNDKPFKDGGTKRIDLSHSLFDDDAIFLYDVDKTLTLASSTHKGSITVRFDDMKYIGLWHAPKTDAPYVCIEPWTSIPAFQDIVDDLETKAEMTHLAIGGEYTASYSIVIE